MKYLNRDDQRAPFDIPHPCCILLWLSHMLWMFSPLQATRNVGAGAGEEAQETEFSFPASYHPFALLNLHQFYFYVIPSILSIDHFSWKPQCFGMCVIYSWSHCKSSLSCLRWGVLFGRIKMIWFEKVQYYADTEEMVQKKFKHQGWTYYMNDHHTFPQVQVIIRCSIRLAVFKMSSRISEKKCKNHKIQANSVCPHFWMKAYLL